MCAMCDYLVHFFGNQEAWRQEGFPSHVASIYIENAVTTKRKSSCVIISRRTHLSQLKNIIHTKHSAYISYIIHKHSNP